MKIRITKLLLAFSFVILNAQSPNLMAIEAELLVPTKGYGVAVIPDFSLNQKQRIWLSIGPYFGFEKGVYDEELSDNIIRPQIKDEMSGTTLVKYTYSSFDGGFQFGGKAMFNFSIITNSYIDHEKRVKYYDFFSIGLGVRFTSHPASILSYQVTSSDNQYEYTEYVEVDYTKRYFDISPEISINGRKWGVLYALQTQNNGDMLHTFGLRKIIAR